MFNPKRFCKICFKYLAFIYKLFDNKLINNKTTQHAKDGRKLLQKLNRHRKKVEPMFPKYSEICLYLNIIAEKGSPLFNVWLN